MKQEWSRSWLQSKQPRKQRKYRYNAPMHIRHTFMSAHLSKDLAREYGKRSAPVRKGDQVEIMKGSSKGMRGTVEEVNLKKCRVYVEGIIRKKVDGSEIKIPLDASNLKIVKLNADDKARSKSLYRGMEKGKKEEKKTEKEKKKEEAKKDEKKIEKKEVKKEEKKPEEKKTEVKKETEKKPEKKIKKAEKEENSLVDKVEKVREILEEKEAKKE